VKFLLIMQLCSAIAQECTGNVEIYPLYNSFYDCSSAGYSKSLTLVKELGQLDVNQAKIMIQFRCEEITSS
jgi:hypothetical protein